MTPESQEINKIYDMSLLYDFYGELLNEHQRSIYEAAVFEDLSLSEIAATEGISRQGVHDILKRCNKALEEYEEKLHLVAKFKDMRKKIEKIDEIAVEIEKDNKDIRITKIRKLSNEILEEL